ncbi:unnamed protein product [Prorocentrum cordatum]|uniref:Reverse transcriptase domain-containing protein n=1 Tax=Prorocentrum cordatum TaxID=2364126 RepID=A0ABN9SRP8_9DINO|nr:unnamed protein product [Polarella glacialis]
MKEELFATSRPLGLNYSENKIPAGLVVRPFSIKMAEVSCKLQRGFAIGRQPGANIIGIDAYARLASMSDAAEIDLPAVVSHDFARAFPSVAHSLMKKVLAKMNLPGPLLWFFLVLYESVRCLGELGGATVWLFLIWSGIIRGCPASGALFAASLNPFLLDSESTFVRGRSGAILARADGLGGVILKLRFITVLFRIFQRAQHLAVLVPKTCKCFIAPLSGPFSEELAEIYRQAIAQLVPSWANFVDVPNLKYLGMWVGPNTFAKSWAGPLGKWRSRGHLLAGANTPPAVAAMLYSSRSATIPSHIAQVLPPPQSLLGQEAARLAKIFHFLR